MSSEFTGARSLKVKLVRTLFGPTWPHTVLAWDARLLTRDEIAERWTVFAGTEREDVRFSQQDVSDIIALARRKLKVSEEGVDEAAAVA